MNKIKCFIFDIDGTVADRGSRHPFDYTKVREDILKEPMNIIYGALKCFTLISNVQFIFITGRPEICRTDTEQWLDDHRFLYDLLYMRPDDNKEQDARLKLQIYKEHIEPYYEVIAVFEDRSRVVQMWRDICGLTVLQVDKGEF